MSDIPFNEADQGQADDPLLIFAWTDDEPIETITPDEEELETFEDSDFDLDDNEPYIPF